MIVRKSLAAAALASTALLAACVTAPAPKSYAALRAENPRSVMVVPALNSTVNVDAGALDCWPRAASIPARKPSSHACCSVVKRALVVDVTFIR